MRANKPFVLGLTGGMGCGKSEAAKCLRALGAEHVDADAISRELTAPGGKAQPALRQVFGSGVFYPDGTVNRRALAEIVFADPERKQALEAIIHPLVWERARATIASAHAPVVVLDVPLLFESGMDALCDETWSMSAPEEVQIERIRERDGLNETQIRARLANQLSSAERNARATRVIDSDRAVEETRAELSRLYAQLLARVGG